MESGVYRYSLSHIIRYTTSDCSDCEFYNFGDFLRREALDLASSFLYAVKQAFGHCKCILEKNKAYEKATKSYQTALYLAEKVKKNSVKEKGVVWVRGTGEGKRRGEGGPG